MRNAWRNTVYGVRAAQLSQLLSHRIWAYHYKAACDEVAWKPVCGYLLYCHKQICLPTMLGASVSHICRRNFVCCQERKLWPLHSNGSRKEIRMPCLDEIFIHIETYFFNNVLLMGGVNFHRPTSSRRALCTLKQSLKVGEYSRKT